MTIWKHKPRKPRPQHQDTKSKRLDPKLDPATAGVVYLPDETSLRPVDEVPAVSCVVPPANVVGVMPQCTDLTTTHTRSD